MWRKTKLWNAKGDALFFWLWGSASETVPDCTAVGAASRWPLSQSLVSWRSKHRFAATFCYWAQSNRGTHNHRELEKCFRNYYLRCSDIRGLSQRLFTCFHLMQRGWQCATVPVVSAQTTKWRSLADTAAPVAARLPNRSPSTYWVELKRRSASLDRQ